MIQAELKVVGGKHDGKVIPLSVNKFLVGREKDCHLRPNSEMVSRHHCVFTSDNFTVRLRDLGSTNGTLVNGERIRGEVVLKPGDHVAFGKLEFEVLIGSVTPDLAPQLSAVNEDTAELARSETMFSLPPADAPPSVLAGDTAVISQSSAETYYEQPVYDPANYEQPVYGQTMYGQPSYDPNAAGFDPNAVYNPYPAPGYSMLAYPVQPNPAEWQAAYPGYAQPAYPQPGFPGYPPAGNMYPGYPPMPGGYPGYPQPQYGVPGYPPGQTVPGNYAPPVAAPQAPAPEGQLMAGPAGRQVVVPPMRLPNPEETGAAAPVVAPAGGANPAAAAGEVKPSNSAADIIKAYRQRR